MELEREKREKERRRERGDREGPVKQINIINVLLMEET